MFPISRYFYFPPFKEKNPWHGTETMFPLSWCCYFPPFTGKKFPDMELKQCSLYLAVVIFRSICAKKSLTWNWNYVPYISLLLFSAQCGKTIPWHETETMFPLSRYCYFPPFMEKKNSWHGTEILFPISCCRYLLLNMGKNSLTWTWNYVPFISLLLFSAQYEKKFPWHRTETMFPFSRCCYFPHNVEENLYFVWRGGGRTDTIHHGPQLCPSPPPPPSWWTI